MVILNWSLKKEVEKLATWNFTGMALWKDFTLKKKKVFDIFFLNFNFNDFVFYQPTKAMFVCNKIAWYQFMTVSWFERKL